MTYTLFYGGFMSNWYPCNFIVDGKRFTTSEQYFMYHKALLMGDTATAEKILVTENPSVCKALGRLVKNWNQELWDENKLRIMSEACTYKFKSSEDLARRLLATGDTTLVEASPTDCIWGIGLTEHDPNAYNPKMWRGLNLLGEVLMVVRKNLCAEAI